MNKLREKIEKREKLCGTITSLTDPAHSEMFGHIGYDYVWIDMEHTYMSYKDVMCHINSARAANMPAIVRVPQHDLTATKKIIDMGPEGIIFPMAKSAKEAKELIEMTLFPPNGTRGFGPLGALQFGKIDAQKFVDKGSFELCRFVQIEHIDFLNELEEIVEYPYIDGFIFGPNDLSGSLGIMGHAFDKKVADAINRAIEILRKNNKYIGLAVGCSAETIDYWSQFDADMLTCGADWNFIYDGAKNTLDYMNSSFKNK